MKALPAKRHLPLRARRGRGGAAVPRREAPGAAPHGAAGGEAASGELFQSYLRRILVYFLIKRTLTRAVMSVGSHCVK